MILTPLPHLDGFSSRKAAEFCGSSRWRSNCGAKNRCPSDGVFHLDRLGHSMLAFRAEQGISLHWTPRIKVLPRSSRSDLFKLSLPATQGVVPKKPEALIQVYFPAQLRKLGLRMQSCGDGQTRNNGRVANSGRQNQASLPTALFTVLRLA